MVLVCTQSFGINAFGGGPRILRALLTQPPEPVLSVCMGEKPPPPTTLVKELHIPHRPSFGRLEATRFRLYLDRWFTNFKRQQSLLEQVCRDYQANALHAIAHGADFWVSYQVAKALKLPFYITVHDRLEYTHASSPALALMVERLGEVWRNAEARMVISEEMGEGLEALYGKRPWTVVTDGLEGISPLRERPKNSFRIYFAGAIHLSYAATFTALAEALVIIRQQQPEIPVSLTIRGSAVPDSFQHLPVRALPWAPEQEIERDMEQADLLYLPLPFEPKYEMFWRYSLSTKLVTYLGSGLPILYHGPAEAAAGRLLARHQAAVLATSLDPKEVARCLLAAGECAPQVVENAQQLARSRFLLAEQRKRFWATVATGR
ncbi:glycosyltransferase [Chthonomonas calidirosea]|uniref:glycosyltransferase n=1 Tax=Chthonomonas calidirosea TaxID=454171 RepID=UPI0006ECB7D4|nr:glycosyltransferase [Chthonomonas calidirosea]CEK15910.1 Glycosyl transferases group 1 [Chthonomonas calidirosea]